MATKPTLLALILILAATSAAQSADQVTAVVSRDGRIHVTRGNTNTKICELGAGLYDPQWKSAQATSDERTTSKPLSRALRLAAENGGTLKGLATVTAEEGVLTAKYSFTPDRDIALNSLHIAADFTIESLAGGSWKTDNHSGKFPHDFGDTSLFNGSVRTLQIMMADGESLAFRFPSPTDILIQDNRQWGPSFVIRVLRSSSKERPFRKGVPVKLDLRLAARGDITVHYDRPVTIVAGKDWIPLDLKLDIQPGSALDFSHMRFADGPAGKHGWLSANTDGTFSFERQPDTPVRFYGVNLCFSAHYLSHAQSDQLADRLVRLGYNTVRFHHHERELTENQSDSTQLNPRKLDQLDYLFAALTRRGIYVTTDLYVSRPVNIASILPEFTAGRKNSMNAFKVLTVNNDKAYENWKAFARNLLTHVNPYTQHAYKDDPGLAWLSLINEGNLGNYLDLAKEVPDYQQAWNTWLTKHYGDRAGLSAAWGSTLQDSEDPKRGSVRLEGSIRDRTPRARDMVRFLAHVEKSFFLRATQFLREELGVKALITNMNGWTNHALSQTVRAEMDYVDDHFYVDHPRFLEQSWRLPSRCPNTSPVAGGAGGGRHITFTRLFDRPFTLSEYNYSGPGRYRGVGGILTGSMGALQGWGVIWRFAYSHSRDDMFQPDRIDYFNMSTDPLSQAAERASICLFLRGDMRPAPHRLTVAMTREDLDSPPDEVPQLAPAWHWAAWVTRVGTLVVDGPGDVPAKGVTLPLGWAAQNQDANRGRVAGLHDPYQLKSKDLTDILRKRGILSDENPTDPAKNIFQSETGEITIDGPRDVLTLDTPCTAGGFAPAGETIQTGHGFQATVRTVPATIWVSALDQQPIVAAAGVCW